MALPSVLIVEDSISQREYLLQLCIDIGVQSIEFAENGKEALKLIERRANDYDLLLCDLEMPDLDGIELIHLLAIRKVTSGLVIISGRERSLISAVQLMAQTEGLWVLGAMQKPIHLRRLKAIFRLYRLYHNKNKINKVLSERRVIATPELIKESLSQHRFVLHYQPQLDLKSKTLLGVEALVRLQHSSGSLVFPNDFIPLCESCNLIDELTYEVIWLALEQSKRWQKLGMNFKVSVNLSALSFDNPEFCNKVMQLIKTSGAEVKNLVFEVTETAVVKNIGKALSILARLKLSGCSLSIDDFGTGYSSVKQLSEIPFDELKIDRSLIDGVSRKKHLQVIVESTISMCKKLGLVVVAEGIEKKHDWDYLVKCGCDIAQGYYISPPMPEQRFLQWFESGMPNLT